MKNTYFWLKTSIVLQFLTAIIHSLSFFNEPQPQNDSEKQLIDLMVNYKMDLGQGFTPTMDNIFMSMSICFTLLYILGGAVNWFLLVKKVPATVLRGMVRINLLIFGIAFTAMLFLTFLPPIICTGLIFISLMFAVFTLPKETIQVK